MGIHTLTLIWQEITIDITHNDCWSDIPELDHYLQHIAIKRRDDGKLPMTETGYRSHFMYGKDALEPYGDAISLVEAWLNEAGQSSRWKAYVASQKQLTLF